MGEETEAKSKEPAVRNGSVAIDRLLGLREILRFGRIETRVRDAGRRPAVRRTLASISQIAGVGAGDNRSEAPRAVSHLRRSHRFFLRTQPLRAGLTSAAPTALSYLSDSAELFFVFELTYSPYFS